MLDKVLSHKLKAVGQLLLEGLSYRQIASRYRCWRGEIKLLAKEIHGRLSSMSPTERRDSELEQLYAFLSCRFRTSLTSTYVTNHQPRTITDWHGHDQVRINELARALEVKAKTIVELLPSFGVTEKKTHSSSIPAVVAERMRRHMMGEPDEAPAPNSQDEFVGLAFVGGRFRLLTMRPDGTYNYLDAANGLHNLIYTVTSETRAVEHAIENLEDLLNTQVAKEEDFQRFFEENPDFITSDEHVEARSDVYLTREGEPTLKPDFVLKPLDPTRTCDILELKLPSAKVHVLKSRRERLSQAVMEARAQLMEYSNYFDDATNREGIQEKYKIFAFRPRMFVIIGRRGSVSPIIRRKAELTADNLHLKTYDEIIERMRHKLKSMTTGRRQ